MMSKETTKWQIRFRAEDGVSVDASGTYTRQTRRRARLAACSDINNDNDPFDSFSPNHVFVIVA